MSEGEDLDFDEIVGDSNGGAYRLVEERSGPPLSYVAEKARNSLWHLHALAGSIDAFAVGGAPQPDLVTQAMVAFHYGVVSYLALNNMLDMANGGHAFISQLLAMSPDDFEKWLDMVDGEGSVLG